MWETLFHQAFVERGKSMVRSLFAGVSIDDRLEDALREIMETGRRGNSELRASSSS